MILNKDNIILFTPLPNISTAFTSQYIRILYPAILNYKNGVMITDIDMIPMSSTYYTKSIENYDNDKFIVLRNVCQSIKQFPICYCVANPKTWSNIFNINSIDDIKNRLISVFIQNEHKEGHGNIGWSLDQVYLYKAVNLYNKKSNILILLRDKNTNFSRFDRKHLRKINKLSIDIENNISSEKYSDYHCKRPFDEHKEINNRILELLPQK